jgi:RNA-binding protein 23/39
MTVVYQWILGFILFAHAEHAKRAMENLNGFELAGRPMKVGHVTERNGDTSNAASTAFSAFTSSVSSSFPSVANLDSDDLDHRGINLGATGRLALMAKLSEGSGLQMPKHAMDALQAAHMQAAGSQHARMPEPPNPQQLATVTAVGTQCFMLSNMFDPLKEASQNSDWAREIRDEVIEECNKFGGVVHIYVDEKSVDGNVYVKCTTIASGKSIVYISVDTDL